jgi:hypothetical protein
MIKRFNQNIKIQNYRNNCLQYLQSKEDKRVSKQVLVIPFTRKHKSLKINEEMIGPDLGARTDQ